LDAAFKKNSLLQKAIDGFVEFPQPKETKHQRKDNIGSDTVAQQFT